MTQNTHITITAPAGFGADMTKTELDVFARRLLPAISTTMRANASNLGAVSGNLR